MDLSIIIVNYRTYDLTKQTINSVINKNHPFDYEYLCGRQCLPRWKSGKTSK